MSKTMFTPGPWKMHPKTEMIQQPGNPPSFEISSEVGSYWIAQVQANAPYVKTCEANARLIAAAPEMYEALIRAAESILRGTQQEQLNTYDEIQQLLNRINNGQ